MLRPVADDRRLDERLAAAGVAPGTAPAETWRRLREVEGQRATVIDLYELAARPRGLVAHELPLAERVSLARSVMPAVWPGWTVTQSSERPGDLIEIVDYDETWPARFEKWRRLLRSALGDLALRIEHVGSTSVPGLAAKPIVDVQASVADLDNEASYVPPIETIGLQLRSRDELHRYFRPFRSASREVHLHVCRAGSTWERDHLRFRDLLREDGEARDAYSRAKRLAATRWADDGFAYTDAKTEVILQILATATA